MTNEAPGKTLQETIWADALPHIMAAKIPEDRARAMIGKWMGRYDHNDIRYAVTRSIHAGAGYPPGFITKVLENRKRERVPEPTELDDRRLLDKIAHMRRFCETRAVSQYAHKLLGELEAAARARGLVRHEAPTNR